MGKKRRGHSQEHCQEHRRENKYQQTFTFLENVKLRAATFGSCPTPHQRTKILQGSPTLACPYPCNPGELCSQEITPRSPCAGDICAPA